MDSFVGKLRHGHLSDAPFAFANRSPFFRGKQTFRRYDRLSYCAYHLFDDQEGGTNFSRKGLSCYFINMALLKEKAAQDFARIKTHIETCRRNSINEIHALQRLCEGNPYTVEILGQMCPENSGNQFSLCK